MECLNQITLIGAVVSHLEYSHECYGEKFYTAYVKSNRISEISDTLEVSIPSHALLAEINEGDTVKIQGRVSSKNAITSGKNKLSVFVFANEISVVDELTTHENTVNMEGFICRPAVLRETPLGREIVDLLLATNSKFRKSSYIPSIAWGRSAKYIANTCEVGTKLNVQGRLQSREYIKEGIIMTAYELSVAKFEVVVESEVNVNENQID